MTLYVRQTYESFTATSLQCTRIAYKLDNPRKTKLVRRATSNLSSGKFLLIITRLQFTCACDWRLISNFTVAKAVCNV